MVSKAKYLCTWLHSVRTCALSLVQFAQSVQMPRMHTNATLNSLFPDLSSSIVTCRTTTAPSEDPLKTLHSSGSDTAAKSAPLTQTLTSGVDERISATEAKLS